MQADRRSVVRWALGTSGLALAAGCSEPEQAPAERGGAASSPATATVVEARQPGVARPVPRQRHLGLRALDLAPGADPRAVLATLGDAVRSLPDVDALTVTVGVGPTLVARALGPGATGAADLPVFASDDPDALPDASRGGDLLVQVCADLQRTVRRTERQLLDALAGSATVRWGADGFRGDVDAEGRGARNLLGFQDGIAVPESGAELDSAVWTDGASGLADATVAVVRRIRLDTRGFRRLPAQRQEEVIGRRKDDGAPLSGGTTTSDVDLQAKSDTGVYDIAVDAHVRRAHPFTGGAEQLMLRRSYSYDDGAEDRGLVFVSFQRELAMFVDTQRAMDDGDALMAFATTTATGTWLVPPWDRSTPLGSVLYPA